MPAQIMMDRNIINVLSNEESLKDKLLSALSRGNIVVHLTDTLLQELLIDNGVARRSRHASVFYELYNGQMVLTMKDMLNHELNRRSDSFHDQATNIEVKQLLSDMSNGRLLSKFWENKKKELLKAKELFDNDFKMGQEANLKNVFSKIKEAKKLGLLGWKSLERINFEQYYAVCSQDEKLHKLQKLLLVNGVTYDGNLSLCIDNSEFPRINSWLRSWYAYHYFTVQKWWTTLRKNDASDLVYIFYGFCADNFVTDDKMMKAVGNICYNATDKFINWSEFRTKFLSF